MRVQFICKRNETYGFKSYTRRSSGLYNSTRFIVESLNERDGIEAEIIEVRDNNDIDREVTRFKPDLVVIEALWVVPEKFPILMKLHPHVSWTVHLHSHMPFLALEGIAMEWIRGYADQGIGLIANSEASYDALRAILTRDEVIYLPNVYLSNPRLTKLHDNPVLNVACFGAVRPLKNQLLQALAAILFAKSMGKPLRFHINGTRVETGGDPVLKNLRQLFLDVRGAELVESPWNEPEDFLDLVQTMDIGMQVSLTETFNVVSADYVTAGIPIVVSKEITWASKLCVAQDDSLSSIVDRMNKVYRSSTLVRLNQWMLNDFSHKAQMMWAEFVRTFS
jgi:hypothetical protein